MKKYLSILVIFLLSVTMLQAKTNFGDVLTNAVDTVYQDGRDAVSAVYGDLKTGVTTIYPDVKNAVVQIAQGLGIAAEHVYTVLVKKFLVDGVKELAIFILGIILVIFGGIWWNKVSKTGVITYKVVPSAVLLLSGIICWLSVNYNELFMGLINPEYGAINYILEYSKSILS